MAKLTSPRISVTFTELGISAIGRGEKGVVAVLIRENAPHRRGERPHSHVSDTGQSDPRHAE